MGRTVRRWVLKDIALPVFRELKARERVVGKKAHTEEFYTAEQVMDMIEMLLAKNAQGYDIYVTPIDPTKHYFCLTT